MLSIKKSHRYGGGPRSFSPQPGGCPFLPQNSENWKVTGVYYMTKPMVREWDSLKP